MFSEEFLPYDERRIIDVLEEFRNQRLPPLQSDWLPIHDGYDEWLRYTRIQMECKDIVIKGNQVFFILNNSEIV